MEDITIVVGLDEFTPIVGRAASGGERRRLERFAEVRERLNSHGRSHPGLLPLANLRFEVSRLLPAVSSEPGVAAAGGVPIDRMAVGRRLTLFADVPDREHPLARVV